jgi:hypothetical protein
MNSSSIILQRCRLTPEQVRRIAERSTANFTAFAKWLADQHITPVSTVQTFLVEVSPSLAQIWLKRNTGNRKPSKAKIRRFAEAMKAGRWVLNGESIKFSTSGRLIDGQSRLLAIVQADVSTVLEVRGDLPDKAQESMDCGELRKGAHTLEMLGEANASILAPALKLVWLWKKGWLGDVPFGSSRVLENSEIPQILAQHEGLKASAGWAYLARAQLRKLMAPSEAAFFHYICGTHDPVMRDHFFDGLVEGVGLTRSSPVYQLREKLIAAKAGGGQQLGRIEVRALIITAWNLVVSGGTAARLSIPERFPVIADKQQKSA